MAGIGGALNLSLLSRGVGEVTKNGHERIEVLFEPQDYYNFAGNTQRIFLPPIQPTYAFDSSPTFSRRSNKPEIPIPKTFTTRKGALLLFSEDLAHKNRVGPIVRRHHYHSLDETKFSSTTPDEDDGDLKTVDDLAKSILLYGNQESPDLVDGYMNMKFIRGRRKNDYFERQIRPGFSAKRYLSSWTKSWDDAVLEKVISKGYLTEKSLFYYNPLMPHLQRRLNDDMSHYPVPYKLMRSMLMSPGSLSGYTFYRVRPESADTIISQEEFGAAIGQGASIKVISTKDGIQREVTYASLDRHAKEEVLTDLLVKSAVHYAMKKQQEYMDETYYSKNNKIVEVPESPVPKFDMQDAVESLLDGQKKKVLLDAGIVDDKSSEHSGSFKGKAKRSKGSKSKRTSDRSMSSSKDDKEYVGNIPVVSMRGPGEISPTPLHNLSGTLPLPPIGEASREQTTVQTVVLPPVNSELDQADGIWATGDDDHLRSTAVENERRRKEERLRRKRGEGGPTVSGGSYLQSSTESLGATSVHSVPAARPVRTHWKGSNQSLRSLGSKKGFDHVTGSGDEASLKGSVIFGPDGHVISVGGTIQRSPRVEATAVMIDQVTDANRIIGRGGKKSIPTKDLVSDESDDEPEEWKHSKAIRRRDMARREIDYTAGDIDATQSISSWSYMSRDYDQVPADVMGKTQSLPGLADLDQDISFRMPKDITILSRATEKTEENERWETTPGQDTFSSRYAGGRPGTENRTSSLGGEMTAAPSRLTSVSVMETPYSTNIETPLLVPKNKIDEESKDGEMYDAQQGDATVAMETETSRASTNTEGPAPVSQITFVKSNMDAALSNIDMAAGSPEEGFTAEVMTSDVASEEEVDVTLVDVNTIEGATDQVIRKDSAAVGIGAIGGDTVKVNTTGGATVDVGYQGEAAAGIHTLEISTEDLDTKQSMAADDICVEDKQSTPIQKKSPEPTEDKNENEVKSRISRQPSRASVVKSVSGETDISNQQEGATDSAREGSLKSQISEEDIVNALTEHAQQIAASVLSSKIETGQNLEADVRHAAEMWMESHPPRQISRSQSIQEVADSTVIDEILEIQKTKRKSAGPTAGEYRELIKESLTTVMKAQGLSDDIPVDTEISKEVIDALTNGSLTPDDLELVHDSDSGKSVIRSRSQMANAMGGVKEGHIYMAGAKDGKKAPVSIPFDRSSNVDVGEFDVITYGTAERESHHSESEKAPSERAPSEKAPSEKVPSEKAPSEKAPSEKAPSEKAPSVKAPSEKMGKSQPASILGESITEEAPEVVEDDKKSTVSFKGEVEPPVDEFQKAVEEIQENQAETEAPVQEEAEIPDEQRSDISKKSDEKSVKSEKSRLSDKKSKVSDTASQKGKSELDKRDEFIVGKVKQTHELEQLYGPVESPTKEQSPVPEVQDKSNSKPDYKGELEKLFGKLPSTKDVKGKPKEKKTKPSPPPKKPKEKVKKGKAKAKKKEEEKEPEPPPKEPTPPPPKEATPPPPAPEVKSDVETDAETPEESYKSEEESDFEFHLERDDTPSPEPILQQSMASIPSNEENTETENEDDDEDRGKDEAARLRQISNREARAAKRAAQAEKRRQEVERRRKERDEQTRREREEMERQEQLKQELEEARKRNEENRRLRREAEEEEHERELREERDRQRLMVVEQEREKRRKEEYQRRLEDMRRRQIEEERKRQEELMKKKKEEEERRLEEEEMMAKMAEEERIEYEQKKKLQEEERKRREEEERIKREEEAKKAMEEARKLAEEMARRQAELEARLKFNHTIQVESSGMTHTQSVTRAFVFSYYELLSWLGLDIPEFELLKLSQY